MKIELNLPEKMKGRLLSEVLELYSKGEISAGRAAEILGIPRAAFYELLAKEKIKLPEELNKSILEELKEFRRA